MYTVHHDATLLPSELQSADYDSGGDGIPAINASASRDGSGKIHVTLCNLNPNAPAEVTCDLQGAKVGKLSGRVLTAREITAHNTFDQPEVVKPSPFGAFKTTEGGFSAILPAKSVAVLEIETL